MKKILLLFSIISFISFADTPFKHEMRLGYDYSGETKAEGESFDHTVNLELVYEMYDEIYNNLDFGFNINGGVRIPASFANITKDVMGIDLVYLGKSGLTDSENKYLWPASLNTIPALINAGIYDGGGTPQEVGFTEIETLEDGINIEITKDPNNISELIVKQ